MAALARPADEGVGVAGRVDPRRVRPDQDQGRDRADRRVGERRQARLDGDRWTESYFDESVCTESGWNHFELTGPPAVEVKHERFWRLGQVVTALAHAGLRIEDLTEHPGSWRGTDPRIPGKFVLRARKG